MELSDGIRTTTSEVLVPHANAPLTPTGRLRLARRVVDDGWGERRAAERFQVSVTTVRRWVGRYRQHGEAAMLLREGAPRLRDVDLATRQEPRRQANARRYEHPAPGDLVPSTSRSSAGPRPAAATSATAGTKAPATAAPRRRSARTGTP